MIKLICHQCKKIIINDVEKYLENYPDEKYIQCPYCTFHILIKDIEKELLK